MNFNILIEEKIKELCSKLKYETNNYELIKLAMNTKKKELCSNNNKKYENDELAYVGDAFLDLVIAKFFYNKKFSKSDINTKREIIAGNNNYKNICLKYNIDEYRHNGEKMWNEFSDHNKLPSSINGHNSFLEAIIGAVFLDKGFDYANDFVIRIFGLNSEI